MSAYATDAAGAMYARSNNSFGQLGATAHPARRVLA
jgi:hypothetical protein